MKTFILIVCISTLSLSTIRSDDTCCQSKAANIQAKLQDIDLSCLLTRYEELQKAKVKVELQLIQLEGENGRESEVQTLQRMAILSKYAAQSRDEIETMAKEIKKQESVASK